MAKGQVDAELYEFLKEHENHLYVKKDQIEVFVHVPFYKLEDFIKVVGNFNFDEGGRECFLQDDNVCIDVYDFIEGQDNYVSSYRKCFDEQDWNIHGKAVLELEKD